MATADGQVEVAVCTPMAGQVTAVAVAAGEQVGAGALLVSLELMKMEQQVRAETAGTVTAVLVELGQQVDAGDAVARMTASPGQADAHAPNAPNSTHAPIDATTGERPDLAEVRERQDLLADEARPDAVAKRHARGGRTARENVADLLDPGSFVEYGGLAIAAQRSRRELADLQANTPADGLVTGTGTLDGAPVAVAAYDYTVLAGTQGAINHRKKDRLFELAHDQRLAVVLFAEGGGGRPGDVDVLGASYLDARAFQLFARLRGVVPTVAIVHGRCFAGNAALAGCADLLIATATSNLGMAGPAMIEGGGLGTVAPEDIGPIEVQRANGVVDVVVADEAEAVTVARHFLSLASGRVVEGEAPDPEVLRHAIPENRRAAYDVRALLAGLVDVGTLLELRADAAPGMVTALGRIGGRPVGILANDPRHLGGAIDADGADSAVQHLELCEDLGLPVVVLCDTPGFMVGPEAERDGGVRRFGRLFTVGARLTVPIVAVVTRKAYGLGAQAMFGGHAQVPLLTVGWPTSELGPMGLEGAVRLGFRKELDAIEDPAARAEATDGMIALAHLNAAGLNVASFGEIDDVIDPADTRARVEGALRLWSARMA